MSLLRLGKDNWARTSPTKEGIIFILLSFIVGFSAINTNNNLLYLIFGVMISLVVVSGITSMINLSRIDINLVNIPDIYALTPSSLIFRLKNDKLLIPSFSLTLQLEDARSYLIFLPSHSERDIRIKCFFKKRGWNYLPKISLVTKFPFGFFKKWIKIDLGQSRVLVYPKINEIEINSGNNTDHYTGDTLLRKTGQSEELKSIRDYNPGDTKKSIDWKSTAKVNRMMVKEYSAIDTRNARIVFDPDTEISMNLEHYISEKASLLVEYIKKGFSVDFIIGKKEYKAVYNSGQTRRILSMLALYKR